jgi:hypothetical protein
MDFMNTSSTFPELADLAREKGLEVIDVRKA